MKAAIGKSHKYEKLAEDSRLFPFENNMAYMVWKNELKKAGFLKKDKSTNRHTVHPHILRKFFCTKMATLTPVDIVEALIGREGYLTEVYRRYNPEDLANFYKKGESSLSVFTNGAETTIDRVVTAKAGLIGKTANVAMDIDTNSIIVRIDIPSTENFSFIFCS